MLVALTGASGFVGSFTARALHARGHTVRALVRASSRRDHIASCVAEWREGELHDPQTLAGLVAGAEAVIHSGVDWSVRDIPTLNFERNVLGSLRLLEAARQARVEQFLFVSSVAVYHTIQPDRPLDETHPTWPSGTYGAYKAAIEPHLLAYHQTYGMNTSSWRPAAVYGVDPNLPRSQWFDLIKTVKESGHVSTGQGGKITHVQDVADGLALAVGDESVAGEFYNLVDGYLYWQVAAEMAKELTGSGATIDDRKGAGPKNHFDTRKAIGFFDRHENYIALRRGHDGVRRHVRELLQRL